MKLRIRCTVHDCLVISADEDLRWTPSEEIAVTSDHSLRRMHPTAWELDYSNLYCTGEGDFNHNFVVHIEFGGPGYHA